MSVLEIVLYVLIAVAVLLYLISGIYKLKTGKSLFKKNKKNDEEEE